MHIDKDLTHLVMSKEMNEKVNQMKEQEGNEQQQQQQGQVNQKYCRRTKERRIVYIIMKVTKRKEFYNGITKKGKVGDLHLKKLLKMSIFLKEFR